MKARLARDIAAQALGGAVLGAILGAAGGIVGGKAGATSSTGWGDLIGSIVGGVLGYVAGCVVGIVAVSALLKRRGSLLRAIAGAVGGFVVVLAVIEPLRLNQNTALLWASIAGVPGILALVGFNWQGSASRSKVDRRHMDPGTTPETSTEDSNS